MGDGAVLRANMDPEARAIADDAHAIAERKFRPFIYAFAVIVPVPVAGLDKPFAPFGQIASPLFPLRCLFRLREQVAAVAADIHCRPVRVLDMVRVT